LHEVILINLPPPFLAGDTPRPLFWPLNVAAELELSGIGGNHYFRSAGLCRSFLLFEKNACKIKLATELNKV